MTDDITRLKRQLARREKRIQGLERKIALLESALAHHAVNVQRLPIQVERAVQNALCNVRMIPMLGIGRDAKILEVRHIKADKS